MYQPGSPLTMFSAKDALAEGLRAIESGTNSVDLTTVSAVDSVAVAILLDWQRAASLRGTTLNFYNASPALRSLAKLYGAYELLHFTTDPAQDIVQNIVQDISRVIGSVKH